GHTAGDAYQNRVNEGVLRSGCVVEERIDLTLGADESTQQYAGRSLADAVATLVLTECHRVGKDGRTPRCRERGLEHHRLGHVLAIRLEVIRGSDRKLPAAGV